MPYRLTFQAEIPADLASAAAWYDNQAAGLGDEFLSEYRAALDALAAAPLLTPPGDLLHHPGQVVMRPLALLVVAFACGVCHAAEAVPRTVVYLLDPRIATHTENTMATESGGDRTDIIASRTLTASEAKDLSAIMDAELITGGGTFCGHSPAWAIREYLGDELTRSVTVCGLCGTWGSGGEVSTLKGKRILRKLASMLPLPDVWRSAKTGRDLGDVEDGPFFTLTRQKLGK